MSKIKKSCKSKPKKKKTTVKRKAKKPDNPYIKFLREFRRKHPDWPGKKIIMEGAKMWGSMDCKKRAKFSKRSKHSARTNKKCKCSKPKKATKTCAETKSKKPWTEIISQVVRRLQNKKDCTKCKAQGDGDKLKK